PRTRWGTTSRKCSRLSARSSATCTRKATCTWKKCTASRTATAAARRNTATWRRNSEAASLLDRALEGLGDGQRQHADALLEQRLGLLGRRLAADVALFRFAVMDAPRFLGEALADVFGVRQHVAHHLQ